MGDVGAVVWDPSLLEYGFGETHPLHPVRLDLTMRLAGGFGLLSGVELLEPRFATEAELRRVHQPDYVQAVQAAPELGSEVGWGLGTADNPIFPAMHEAAARVAGASIVAAERVASGAVNRAVNIAGGLHHAMPGRASGFCVYNDCAAAIATLLDQGVSRVAYIDIDVHHGDGVQEMFWSDPRVLTISLHQHPHTLWPGTGFATETGHSAASGGAVNVGLPPGTDDAAWQRAFHAVVPSLLDVFRPEVLVTQCGADTHHEDPLADLSLSVDGHRAIYQALRDCAERYAGGRWLALGGGGYSLFRVVPRAWTHLLATVLDRDLAPNTSVPQDWLAHTIAVAGNTPIPTTMTDERSPEFTPWGGTVESPVDTAIRDTRRAVFPLHGLDPADSRD